MTTRDTNVQPQVEGEGFDTDLGRGDAGAAVRQLQEDLVAAGFDPGTVDGIFGAKTAAALAEAQAAAAAAQDIPPDATLIKVRNPVGGGGARYFLESTYSGVVMRWEVGDQTAFDSAFPDGMGGFENVRTEGSDDGYEGLIMGSAEELFGQTETISGTLDRGLREFGQEDLPAWMRNDPAVMTVLLQGSQEGWSAGRILNQVFTTDAAQTRFPGIEVIQDRLGGGTLSDAVTAYLNDETAIKASIRKFRGADSAADNEYIGSLIGTGWTAGEVDTVLEGEFRMRQNPGALDNLNEILQFQGLDPIGEQEFLEAITGRAAPEGVAAINDALRFTALQKQGLDISPTLADALGDDGELDILDENTLGVAAEEAARNVLRFGLELEAGKFGIGQPDVIAAAFGEGASAEVQGRLAQFARERQQAAKGVGGFSSFIDAGSNLRLQGLEGL